MRVGCVMALLVLSRSVFAEPSAEPVQRRASSFAVQGGVLPNVSFAGVEFRHALSTRFELSVSASYGLAAVAAAIPRIAFPIGDRMSLAVGLGPSFAYEKGGPLEDSRAYAQGIADLELSLSTADRWLLQVRTGISAYSEDGSFSALPFIGLGIGRVW
jgi:hypothetical protein